MRQAVYSIASMAMLASLSLANVDLRASVPLRSPPLADNSTYGNIDQIATTHVDLYLRADFEASSLSGTAVHTMVVKESGV